MGSGEASVCVRGGAVPRWLWGAGALRGFHPSGLGAPHGGTQSWIIALCPLSEIWGVLGCFEGFWGVLGLSPGCGRVGDLSGHGDVPSPLSPSRTALKSPG